MFDPAPASSTSAVQAVQEVQAVVGLLKLVIGALFVAVSAIVATTWRAARASSESERKLEHGERAYQEIFGVAEENKEGLVTRHRAIEAIVSEHSARLRGIVTGLRGHGSDPEIIAQNIAGNMEATVARMHKHATDAAAEARRALVADQEARFGAAARTDTGGHRALTPRVAPPVDSLDEPSDPFGSDFPPPLGPPKRR